MQRCSFLRRCSSHQSWMPSRGHLGYCAETLDCLVGGFTYFFIFTRIPGEIFFKWVAQPPTGCELVETWKVFFGWLGLWMILMMFLLVHWPVGLINIIIFSNLPMRWTCLRNSPTHQRFGGWLSFGFREPELPCFLTLVNIGCFSRETSATGRKTRPTHWIFKHPREMPPWCCGLEQQIWQSS